MTGDPLHSLHGTADLAETVDRRRDPLTGPYWAAKYLGYTLREPMAIGIPIGLAFAWQHARARAWLPFAAAVAMLVVFLASPLFGLPLIGRYVRTPGRAAGASSTGSPSFGWRMLPRGQPRAPLLGDRGRGRRRSPRSPTCPGTRSSSAGSRTASTSRAPTTATCATSAEARAVRAAFDRCGTIATADHRPIPHLRWWIEGDPGTVAPVAAEARDARGHPAAPAHAADAPLLPLAVPARGGARGVRSPLYRNASWRVLADPRCAGGRRSLAERLRPPSAE